MFFSSRLIVATLLTLSVCACQPMAGQTQPQPEVVVVVISEEQKLQANQQAETVFAEYVNWRMENSPLLASRSHLPGQFDWDDISSETREQQLERIQAFRTQLKAINEAALNRNNIASYHTLMDLLEYQLLLAPLDLLQDPLASKNNWLLLTEATLIHHHPINNIEDAHDYIARIKALPVLYTRWREQLNARAQAGYFSPEFAYQQNINQLEQMLTTTPLQSQGPELIFWQDFQNKLARLTLYPSTRQLLLKKMKKALKKSAKPALQQLQTLLQQQLLQASSLPSLQNQPQGMRYYQLQLQHYSQTELDANQIFQFALAETAHIQQQLITLAQQHGWQASQEKIEFSAVLPWLKQQQSNFNQHQEAGLNRAELLGFQQQKLNELAQQLPYQFTVIPQTPLAVSQQQKQQQMPLSYHNQGNSFAYIPAYADQPAQLSWNPDATLNLSRSDVTLNLISYAVPGLHMQLSLAAENNRLPAFRRQPYLAKFNKGWLMYSQKMALEETTDISLKLAFLQQQLWQSVRLVADTGIHAKGWTRLQTVEFIQNNLPTSVDQAQAMINQVTLNPAQASEEYFNFRALEKLHQTTRKKLQQQTSTVSFDNASYHSHLLTLGAMPIDALEQQINIWTDDLIKQAEEKRLQAGE